MLALILEMENKSAGVGITRQAMDARAQDFYDAGGFDGKFDALGAPSNTRYKWFCNQLDKSFDEADVEKTGAVDLCEALLPSCSRFDDHRHSHDMRTRTRTHEVTRTPAPPLPRPCRLRCLYTTTYAVAWS